MTQQIILRLIDGLFVKCEVITAMLMGIKFHYDMPTCRFASNHVWEGFSTVNLVRRKSRVI